jgi:ribonucleases P/MRP protein subunit RPP40
VLNIGHSRDTEYLLNQDGASYKLNSVSEEKDLGVMVTNTLSPQKQCVTAVNQVNIILGMIRRQFPTNDQTSFLIPCKSFIRPHLEYAVQAWSPQLKKDIALLKAVQRRVTHLVAGTQKLSYPVHQTALGLTTLEQ